MNISKEYFNQLWSNVPKYSNSIPHLLQLKLFEKYSEERLNNILRLTSIHKLSYKFSEENFQKKDTFFERVIKNRIKQ